MNVNTGAITALATIAIAFFTSTLWLVTDATVSLAREDLDATHRPKLRIRLLTVEKFEIGKPVEIGYEIANVGSGPAFKITSKVTLKIIVRELEPQKEESWERNFEISKTIITGGHLPVKHSFKDVLVSGEWGSVVGAPNGLIKIRGILSYEDRAGIIRKTGFFRKSSDDLNRFRRFGGRDIQCDYEYED